MSDSGTKNNKEIHSLAGFCHGALASLHLIGVVYNLKRKHWYNVAIHGYALAFSLNATAHHAKICRNCDREAVKG